MTRAATPGSAASVVRNQLSALYQKLGVARRTEAVAKASVMNLCELKP